MSTMDDTKNKTTNSANNTNDMDKYSENNIRDNSCNSWFTNNPSETKILYKEECFKINHAIFEVHNQLGNGFLEAVYQEALEIELEKDKIPFEVQKLIQIFYNDKPLKQFYKADIVCYDKIIIEIKAVTKISNEHKAQLMHYLKATNLKLGLLVNFGSHPKVEICRIIR